MYTPKIELGGFSTLPSQRKQIILRGYLEALICADWQYLEEHPETPSIYDVLGPHAYVLKVRPMGLDAWQDIPRTIELMSGDCVAEGSLVRTERGEVPIELVKIGDRVATRTGWNRVTNQGCVKLNAETRKLVTSSGREISATPEHRIWTANRDWTPLGQLRPGDELVELHSDGALKSTRVSSIVEAKQTNVYDLTVQDKHEFFANGINLSNCKDFAAWRVAELRKAGYDDVYPHIKVSMHNDPTGRDLPMTVYHIQVRIHETIEDPSAILGMPTQVSYDQLRG